MNVTYVQNVLSVSLTKAECLSRMGLEHTTLNYRMLADVIRQNGLNTSHLQGIKATIYVKNFLTPVEDNI